MESNDRPEIPDRGETSNIPGLPSRAERETDRQTETERQRQRDRERQRKTEGERERYV